MARWNLKVNYGTVKEVAESAKLLAAGVDSVKNEMKNVQNAISNCSGAAITALDEKTPEIDGNLDKLQDGLNKLGDIFNEFAENMLEIISYGDGGLNNVVHINTNQVKRKLQNLINLTDNLTSYATVADLKTSSMYAPYIEMSDADRANLASINTKLESIDEMMAEVGNYISQFEDDFEKMRTKVADYENMDDDMKRKIKDLYEDLADIKWWQTTTFKVIVGATLIVAAVAVIIFVPAVAGVAAFAVGVAKSVVAFGALNTTIGLISAYYSGDDIEDAAATGLFEGTIEGLLVGGASQAGKTIGIAASKSKYGKQFLAKFPNVNVKDMVNFFDFNVEYVGQVANATFKKAYNGKEINMRDIVLDEALKHTWKAMDKVAMKDITLFFKGKTKEIIEQADKVGDFSDVRSKMLGMEAISKMSQYATKSAIYFGQLGVDAVMNEINDASWNNENISLSDMYNSVTDKYDGTKLLKYVIKDDFKKVVKDIVGRLEPDF